MTNLFEILQKIANGELSPDDGHDTIMENFSVRQKSDRNGQPDKPYQYQIDQCPNKKIPMCSNPGSYLGCSQCRVHSPF